MSKDVQRQLKFIEGFEDSEPDISHNVSFRFCKDLLKGKRCLDLGCWTGRFMRLLDGFSKNVGVDINHSAIKIAKEFNPNSFFIQSTGQHLSFKDNSFDIVTMFAVLEHLPMGHEKATFSEVNRILKKGGYLILSTPNSHWILDIFDIAHWMVGHRHYRLDKLEGMLNQTGYKLYKTEIIGGLLSVLFIPLSYFLKFIMRLNDTSYKKISRYFDRHYDKPGFYDIYLIAQKV